MRLFIAIEIPAEIKLKIRAYAKKFEGVLDARFVSAKNLHITAKFIGETKDSDKIKAKCSEIKSEKFRVELARIGAFPSKDNIRVLWVGVSDGAKEIENLNQQLCEKLDMKECRQFNSHITLARVKNVRDKKKLAELFTDEEFGEFEVSAFKLMKSTLTPNGPVYEVIEQFKLQ